MNVWQPVVCIGEDHEREGQSGTVAATYSDEPERVSVKWDLDGEITSELTANLRTLA